MSDRPLDPHDERLDDIEVPRDDDTYDADETSDLDEPVVDLDAVDEDDSSDEETSSDKYVQVIDGRPETLGFTEETSTEEPGSERAER